VHEEVVRGPLAELAERFAGGARGEVTIVVEAAGEDAAREESWDAQALAERAAELLGDGMRARDAAAALAEEANIKKRDAYTIVVAAQKAAL
jgi:16S rRNA (cytidine1402-2'-O)-methyltransferase